MAPFFANGTCDPFFTQSLNYARWEITSPLLSMSACQTTLGYFIPFSQPDPYHPNFQRAFYGGANYPSLIRIKAKYDPQDVLYGGRMAAGP
ncbi:hypothetical protein PAAG_02216 [Paracoccidioides lutzii Pb01]|uniref:Berberine/berberine-like domain-containing protein n=1 Tax=Paracoccidioides lutzii (strain ATCC MYA-826 / Pb01) TaxID=502779 RepID=C1GVD9_PARBA|nr:hypothetical protein PAAG_02216 [Paracoccidioides lutzii Pb01]EEH40161.2 hypothetical protein PAAG_02216 [Paracoccidioides lutzii Pb01]